MEHHEILITRLFNDYLAGAGTTILEAVGLHAHNAARPWTNWMTMQILVTILIMVFFGLLKSKLSMDRPGKIQITLEAIYRFILSESEGNVPHHGHRYAAFFGSLFLFILVSNLIGIIPGFESPTMFPYVPVGLAVAAFLYYNIVGMQAQGLFKYLKHLAGPIPALAPLMVPIEIISNLARPLSLSIRLYANMYAGEQVTLLFLALTYVVMPSMFMGLHVFVAFLQAYVFMLLTMLYVGGAVAHEDH
jgi:F-type H+-transporting ATPase subunit a